MEGTPKLAARGARCTIFALLALASSAFPSTPITTTVAAVVRNAEGVLATGAITITPSVAFDAADGTHVELQQVKVTLVNGAFAVALVPTDTSNPAATYTVVWQVDGAKARTETWNVPTTSLVLAPKNVNGATGTNPGSALQGPLANLPATCAVGQSYFATDAAPGSNLYGCTAANTWSLEGGIETVYNGATAVGAAPAIAFLPGTGSSAGITWNISDTGPQIQVTPVLNTALFETIGKQQSGSAILCNSASGSGVTYACSLIPTLTVYTIGMVLDWVPDVNGGGGATTLNVDGLGAVSVRLVDGVSSPASTDIVAGSMRQVWYDGTDFRFVGGPPSGGGGGGAVASVFGRTGAVAAASGDYTAAEVTNAAATNASNTFTAGTQDFSGAAHTRPAIVVSSAGSLPATCVVGELGFVSGATAGQQIYECSATNTWTQQVAGGGGGSTPAPVFDTYANRPTCNSAVTGMLFHASDVSNKHWECNGSAWQPVAFDMLVTEPTALTWTAVSSSDGTATITSAAGVTELDGQAASVQGYQTEAMLTPIPLGTPYTVEVAFTVLGFQSGSYGGCQFLLSNGLTSGATTSGFGWQGNSTPVSLQLYSGNLTQMYGGGVGPSRSSFFWGFEPEWRLKVVDDGTNRSWYFSTGGTYQLLYSGPDTSGVTAPTYFGVGCTTYLPTDRFHFTLYHASVHH